MGQTAGEFVRDTKYLDGRITADGRGGWPRSRTGTARGGGGVPVGEPDDDRPPPARAGAVLSIGICGPEHDARSWTFDSIPARWTRCLASTGSATRTRRRSPARPGRRRAGDRGHPQRRGRHRRLPAHHAGHGAGVDRLPPARRARPVPGAAAGRDRRGQRACSTGREQRRLPLRVRLIAGRLRRGVRAAVRPAGLARAAARGPALPGRRHDHRGGRGLWRTLARFDAVYQGHSSATGKARRDAGASAYARDLFETPASATRSTSFDSSTTTGCTPA